jgi:nitrogen fixation/metabolism regulation signal transduction histidine kinase
MSIRYRLVGLCVVVALLPAIPLSILVSNLLEKSFNVGLSDTMEDALDSGVSVSRKHLEVLHRAFEEETARVVSRLGGAAPDSAQVTALLSGPDTPDALDGFFMAGDPTEAALASPALTHDLPRELADFAPALLASGLLDNTTLAKRPGARVHRPGLVCYETENRVAQFARWAPPDGGAPLLFYKRTDPEFMAHAANLIAGRQVFAQLRLSKERLNRSFFYTFAIVYGAVLAVSLAIAFLISERLAAPIRRLVDATSAVADGDWSIRLQQKAGGEIGSLVAGFNRMVGRLDSQRRRLIDLEKIASWREIGRHLAHEIKNPILPIQLTVQEMRDQYKGDDENYAALLSESVRVVEDELNHLRNLVKEFSTFARMPGLSLVPGSLGELVRDVARLYVNAEVVIDEEPGLPKISFDPDQMRRALVNLFDNSISVNPLGERVRISIRMWRTAGDIGLRFTDSGPGISAEDIPRIFEPYFTTRKGGTGLGLALVKSIVLLHGGTVEVHSRRGEGASFTITLPLAGQPATGVPPGAGPSTTNGDMEP